MKDLRNVADLTIKEIEKVLKAGAKEEIRAFINRVESGAETRKAALKLIAAYRREEAEKMRVAKLYKFEEEFYNDGKFLVAGTDEAGRGPLAGPVSVAAVILPPRLFLKKLNDSKKISAALRENIYEEIMEKAVAVSHKFVSAEEIDRVNIAQAVMGAMYEILTEIKPEAVLSDAVKLPDLTMPWQSVVHGDALSASIAAASIVAKVKRDKLMDEYDKKYPQYGFAKHKGYGTKEHMAAIEKYGPCPIHRMTFAPIKDMKFDQTR